MVEQSTRIRRPGRALIGWMAPDRGGVLLAGGRQEGADDPDLLGRVQAARAAVAARPAGINQDGVVDESHPAVVSLTQRLQGQPDTTPLWTGGWRVGVVDLNRVCSLQRWVGSEQAEERVSQVDPEDLTSVGAVTLPAPAQADLPAQLDELRNAWIISAPTSNLRITGHFGGELEPGVVGFGFVVAIMPSFLQVARHHGRYVLRDGYHRAFGLLARGITKAPAFVRDFGVGELGLGPGLFETDVYLSDRPPLLSDFLDDHVAADVEVPAVQKMILVQGLELAPYA